jgi:hypothetical protein
MLKTSAEAMIEFWGSMQNQDGLMDPGTAGTVRNACIKMLEAYEYWAKVDLRTFNIDEAIRRFKAGPGRSLAPSTRDQYERYFRKAVPSFLQYLDDPTTWESPVPRRRAVLPQSSHPEANRMAPRKARQELPMASTSHIEIAIPSSSRVVHLEIPGELTQGEAQFLAEVVPAYIRAAAAK